MNLIYLLASLAGIALLVGLNHLLLKTRVPVLDQKAAEDLLRLDDAARRLHAFVGDGHAGLAEDEEGTLFAVAVSGDRLVARPLGPTNLAAADYAHGRLTLRLRDYGFRRVGLALAPGEGAAWLRRLEALRAGSDERRQAVIEGEALRL
ncbi:MAG: hypothetical protein KGO02_20520 [Alphaproteobacteria bacterium]|nr:hypothetical protein [Alphaproteobacteria bacterium]